MLTGAGRRPQVLDWVDQPVEQGGAGGRLPRTDSAKLGPTHRRHPLF
jgi:hypothetical protein